MKELQSLLDIIDKSARIALGCWSDVTFAGHHGVAAFFAYENSERRKDVMNIANHLAGMDHKVVFGAIDAPQNEYENCGEAIEALGGAYADIMTAATAAHDMMINHGINPYFMTDFVVKFEREQEEVKGVWNMISRANKEEMVAVNKKLMKKYARKR